MGIAMNPEEKLRRVKAALAEAGLPGAIVQLEPDMVDGVIGPVFYMDPGMDRDEQHRMWWKALVVSGIGAYCWECVRLGPYGCSVLCDAYNAEDCGHEHVQATEPVEHLQAWP